MKRITVFLCLILAMGAGCTDDDPTTPGQFTPNHQTGLIPPGSISGWGNYVLVEPDQVQDLQAVAGSLYHSLGLQKDGSIVAWGDNEFGQCDIPQPNAGYTAIFAGRGSSGGFRR